MSWNSVVEFHQTIRGDVNPESIRCGAEESYKVFNRWEEKEGDNKLTEIRRVIAAKEKDVGNLRKVEQGMKTVGLGEGSGSISKTKAKKSRKDENTTGVVAKEKRKVEARVGKLGGALNGMGLGGEKAKENNEPKVAGNRGSLEFGHGFSKNL
ncbi:hypothetical protein IFR05_006049 [Cadophora sp. M221]|nr:hypothetical protein IFR05_006049 [Cadophora sp. M221]